MMRKLAVLKKHDSALKVKAAEKVRTQSVRRVGLNFVSLQAKLYEETAAQPTRRLQELFDEEQLNGFANSALLLGSSSSCVVRMVTSPTPPQQTGSLRRQKPARFHLLAKRDEL